MGDLFTDGFERLALELGLFALVALAREAILDAALDRDAALLVGFRVWLERLGDLFTDGFDRLGLAFFGAAALDREATLDREGALYFGLERLALAARLGELLFWLEGRLARCLGAERLGAERLALDPADVRRLMFETLPRCWTLAFFPLFFLDFLPASAGPISAKESTARNENSLRGMFVIVLRGFLRTKAGEVRGWTRRFAILRVKTILSKGFDVRAR